MYIALCDKPRRISTLYAIHCTLYTVRRIKRTMYTIQCRTMYVMFCTLYTVPYTMYDIYCTLYAIHCILYTVYYTQYAIHCNYTLNHVPTSYVVQYRQRVQFVKILYPAMFGRDTHTDRQTDTDVRRGTIIWSRAIDSPMHSGDVHRRLCMCSVDTPILITGLLLLPGTSHAPSILSSQAPISQAPICRVPAAIISVSTIHSSLPKHRPPHTHQSH